VQAKGTFDKDLFLRYKKAKGEEKRRLEGILVASNEPLCKLLVAQFRGEDPTPPRRGYSKAKRERGIEKLDWEESFAAGMTGMVKAIRTLNLSKGGLTIVARFKIRHELQSAITKAEVVSVPKGAKDCERPKGYVFADESAEEIERARIEAIEAGIEPWAPPTGKDDDDEESKGPKRPASALLDFVTRRLEFRPHFVTTRNAMFRAYENHARILGFSVSTEKLERVLLHMLPHKVRLQKGNLPRNGKPWAVTGVFYRGVRLLSVSELAHRMIVAEN